MGFRVELQITQQSRVLLCLGDFFAGGSHPPAEIKRTPQPSASLFPIGTEGSWVFGSDSRFPKNLFSHPFLHCIDSKVYL